MIKKFFAFSILFLTLSLFLTAQVVQIQFPLNPGFEIEGKDKTPLHWKEQIGGGAKAKIALVTSPVHTGKYAMKITNDSGSAGGVFGSLISDPFTLPANKTYKFSVWVKGEDIKECYIGVAIENGGDNRTYFPNGTFDWREFSVFVTSTDQPIKVTVRVASDDVTKGLYFDDLTVSESKLKRSNLIPNWEPRPYPTVFPRSQKPPAKQLYVLDAQKLDNDIRRMLAVLQGVVNRKEPRIYFINSQQDEFWLDWIKQKGYTGQEKRIKDWEELLTIFKDEYTGVIIFDPELMGTINVACMLGGVENALPVSPSLANQLKLKTVMDLRGRWKKSVEAYRWVFDNYWNKMNHHLLSCKYPLTTHTYVWDYLAEFNVFTFWCSNYSDKEKGNDPAEEEIFLHELYAKTPPNIPVMGWYNYSDTKGIQEYLGVATSSSYGKFTPGTEFNSNTSVHSGIKVSEDIFKEQKAHKRPMPPLQKDKVYIALSILDSGDAQWYFEQYQLNVWKDKERGKYPINWCLNVTMIDVMPAILQWYYENATPNDYFFSAISGIGYTITPFFGNRYSPEEKEKVWQEFLKLTSDYCKRLDIDMIELHNGSWGEPTPPDDKIFPRYIKQVPQLKGLLADLGRHDNIKPDKANYLLEGVPIIHTLTRWKTWTRSDELHDWNMDKEIQRFVNEIKEFTPKTRPAFMNTMPLSWTYFPTSINKAAQMLPSDYVLVNAEQLAELLRQYYSDKSSQEQK